MAVGEVYNLRIHHDEVLQPILRYLKVMNRSGLGAAGLRAQHELGVHLAELDGQARTFDERLAARKARVAARGRRLDDRQPAQRA